MTVSLTAVPLFPEVVRHPAHRQHVEHPAGVVRSVACSLDGNAEPVAGQVTRLQLVAMPPGGQHRDAGELQRQQPLRIDPRDRQRLAGNATGILQTGIPHIPFLDFENARNPPVASRSSARSSRFRSQNVLPFAAELGRNLRKTKSSGTSFSKPPVPGMVSVRNLTEPYLPPTRSPFPPFFSGTS